MTHRRTSASLFLACVLLAAAAASGCDESPTGPSVAVGADVTLAPGMRINVAAASFSLQFDGVDGDSRCPADAICIQGGDAGVRLSVDDDGTVRRIELHTGSLQPVRYGRYSVQLVELSPYPFSSRTIAPGEYRATIRVVVA